MTILNREQALSLAQTHVDEMAESIDSELVILVENAIEIDSGWVFFYNSREFIETQNFGARLLGNGPIFVKTDGTIHILPTHTRWEVAIQNIK